jgi:hypothetical protein
MKVSDTPKNYGADVKLPNATANDVTGERKEKLLNDVGMGNADEVGKNYLFDGGRHKGVCYTHDRKSKQK